MGITTVQINSIETNNTDFVPLILVILIAKLNMISTVTYYLESHISFHY